MAEVDTIVILDGLQFTKPDTADVWTIDGEGSAYEAVKSYAVVLPASLSGVRVIFNNNYDTAASRVHVRVKVTKVTAIGTLAKTENTQALEWTAVAAQAIQETGAIDVSAAYEATLHIDVAISSTTAHTGTEVIVQGRSEDSLDEWTTLTSFVGPIGTATKSDFAAEEAAAQTILSVTNPTAGNLNHVAKFIFIEDTTTVAQCEIAYITECGADA
jgi:hypothetical protein